jgi:hypothetical protein
MTDEPTSDSPELRVLDDDEISAILVYWTRPTQAHSAPPGMVETARHNVGLLAATVFSLRDDLTTEKELSSALQAEIASLRSRLDSAERVVEAAREIDRLWKPTTPVTALPSLQLHEALTSHFRASQEGEQT